jgi:hypothetical protein
LDSFERDIIESRSFIGIIYFSNNFSFYGISIVGIYPIILALPLHLQDEMKIKIRKR